MYQEFLPASNGTKPTELLCEVTAGGNPSALHRGAVDDQHHGAGTSLGDVQSKITGQQPDETLIQKQGPGAVQFLIHVDADVDICKHNETTACMALQSIDKKGGASAPFLASKNGIDKAVSPLISLAQSANGVLDRKETPEFTSITSQGGQTAGQHLQADGDVNQGDKDTIPLDRAVQEQHEQHKQHADVFSQLLDTQADGNPPDVNRAVPLFTTFQKGFNDTVKEIFDKNTDPKMSISGIKVDESLEASVNVKKATCLEDVEVATADNGKTTQLKADDSNYSSDLEPFEKDVKCQESNFQVPLQAASCEDTQDPFALGGQSVSSADEATSSTTPLGCCNEEPQETWPPDFVTHSCSHASASVTAIHCQALPH